MPTHCAPPTWSGWRSSAATDHCVRATVLDGLKEGFDVAVFTNQIAAVDDARGKASLDEMAAAGAEILDK